MNISLGKNQYLFTKYKDIEGYERKITINKYNLYLGSGCQYYDSGDGIYVLGYAIDVLHPQKKLKEMCVTLKKALNNNIPGPQATRNWNGRFVVIFIENDDLTIWHDCCGLKQVFIDVNSYSIFASQARYIAAIKNYQKDPEACQYLELVKKNDKEFSFILDRTIYKDVRRLLPNHYVTNGIISRADLCRERGTSKYAAEIINNSISAISELRPLAVTLTAGWDSRIILSGVKNCPDAIAVTLKYDWMDAMNPDIIVATQLAKIKGLQHKVIDCTEKDDLFYDEYMTHSENGHEYWVQMAQAVRDGGFADSFWVKGSCNEIIRNPFGVLYNWQINEELLCKIYSLPVIPFVEKTINAWLKNAKLYCSRNDISILDLFYWEHRMGSWLAECLNEADVVGEMFSPFNSRIYIENGLAVNVNKRVSPNYLLFQEILECNSFLINRLPVNAERYSTFKARVKCYIKNNLPLIYGLILKR